LDKQPLGDWLQRPMQLALRGAWVEFNPNQPINFMVVVIARGIELCPQVKNEVRIGGGRDLGRFVIGAERLQNLFELFTKSRI
jgi:hypothetical protein